MEIKKVGVVAMTGTMGTGIAQVCAQAGYQVVGSSRNEERVKEALASIDSRLARSVEKGRISQADKDAACARIKGATDMKDFSDCDLVIESAVEDMDVKKRVFAELDKICPKHAILATNSSSLSVIEMASVTNRPGKLVGLHFFNPVPVMKLLEIVETVATSNETIETAKAFAKAVDKTPVVSQDTPGRLTSRLSLVFRLEAIRMVEAGVGSAEDIDTAITLGYNHPMGPLALTDLIGLDTTYDIANALYEQTKDPKFISPILLRNMVAAGWNGRKSGRGFYKYDK